MAPSNNQNQMAIASTSAQAPRTQSRSTSSGRVQKTRRVVKNKPQDLASQGSMSWNNQERELLVYHRARFHTWEPVADALDRSNQAVRSEWTKMKGGEREKEGKWIKKVEACEALRNTRFPSRKSGARTTATTAPAVNVPAVSSSGTACSVTAGRATSVSTDRAADILIAMSMSDGPEVEAGGRRNPPRGKNQQIGQNSKNIAYKKHYSPPTGLPWQSAAADLRTLGILPRQTTGQSACVAAS
jgi:hypothetical protein